MLALKNGWVSIVSHDFMQVLGASKQSSSTVKKNSAASMFLMTGHGMTQVYFIFVVFFFFISFYSYP